MAWTKSPAELIAQFEKAIPADPRVEPKKMFGYPACFTGGNMFMGLHEHRFVLRLGEADRANFLTQSGAAIFEPIAGRPMREYVVAPPSLLAQPAELARWAKRAFAFVAAMPPKAKKAAKKPTKPAAKKPAKKKPAP